MRARFMSLASLLALLSTFTQTSCKPREAISTVQFDEKVSKILDFGTLDLERQREICMRSPLIVFVGNAERIWTGNIGDSVRMPSDPSSSQELFDTVQTAAKQLKTWPSMPTAHRYTSAGFPFPTRSW
jgi:hypothetical protein